MWFDTHCHLDAAEFDADRDAVAARGQEVQVGSILVPAVSIATLATVDAACARYPGCLPAYGIHPLLVDHAGEDDLARLREAVTARRPVAIGEIGLDGFVPGLDMARQTAFFAEQLKIARDFDLPVVLHIRRAQDLVLKQLRRIGVRGGFAHAFNGSRQQADAFIALGCRLGFGGAMTFSRATRIRELAVALPEEAIVLETDSPDIAPEWLAGKRNEPGELPAIGAILAELRGVSIEDIAARTSANAAEVLALAQPSSH
jgi:TatD DNase family protein